MQADLNNDQYVDGKDYAIFAICFNGTGNPPRCDGPTVTEFLAGIAHNDPWLRFQILDEIQKIELDFPIKSLGATVRPTGECVIPFETPIGKFVLQWMGDYDETTGNMKMKVRYVP